MIVELVVVEALVAVVVKVGCDVVVITIGNESNMHSIVDSFRISLWKYRLRVLIRNVSPRRF